MADKKNEITAQSLLGRLKGREDSASEQSKERKAAPQIPTVSRIAEREEKNNAAVEEEFEFVPDFGDEAAAEAEFEAVFEEAEEAAFDGYRRTACRRIPDTACRQTGRSAGGYAQTACAGIYRYHSPFSLPQRLSL